MRFIITEAFGPENVGSMALIENAIKIARSIDKDCEISIFAVTVDALRSTLAKKYDMDKIEVINDLFIFPKRISKIKTMMWGISTVARILYLRILLSFTKKPYKLLCGRQRRLFEKVCNADYIFCIGAERINDIYYKTAYLSMEALDLFEKTGAKLIHMSLTIGPVFNKSTIKKASKVLDNSCGIIVRDQKSFNLLDELKVTRPKTFNSYDIAILQDLLDERRGDELMKNLNLPKDFLCCSVINWGFNKCKGPTRQKEYNISVAETLDYVIEKYDTDIVVTPTVVGRYRVDDIAAGKNMYEYVKNKDRVHLIEELLTPSELAYIYSRSKFSIVTRMHAAILCTGAGSRPIIAINYLYKLREYMKNIGFEDYSIDIDYCTANDLKTFVDRMFKNYEQNCLELKKNIGKMRTKLLTDIKNLDL